MLRLGVCLCVFVCVCSDVCALMRVCVLLRVVVRSCLCLCVCFLCVCVHLTARAYQRESAGRETSLTKGDRRRGGIECLGFQKKGA